MISLLVFPQYMISDCKCWDRKLHRFSDCVFGMVCDEFNYYLISWLLWFVTNLGLKFLVAVVPTKKLLPITQSRVLSCANSTILINDFQKRLPPRLPYNIIWSPHQPAVCVEGDRVLFFILILINFDFWQERTCDLIKDRCSKSTAAFSLVKSQAVKNENRDNLESPC